MLLDEYLDQLDTKKAVRSATSFYDYPWRQSSGVVFLKLVPNALQGVPAELHKECVVSKDALHLLNIYRAFKPTTSRGTSVREFYEVLESLGWKAADEYTPFHLRMYATSFFHMKLMDSWKPEAEIQSAKESKIVFVPVFSVDDKDDKYAVIQDNLKCYEVTEVKGTAKSESYIGLSVQEGFQHSRGEQPEEENMAYGGGF